MSHLISFKQVKSNYKDQEKNRKKHKHLKVKPGSGSIGETGDQAKGVCFQWDSLNAMKVIVLCEQLPKLLFCFSFFNLDSASSLGYVLEYILGKAKRLHSHLVYLVSLYKSLIYLTGS